MYVWCGATTQRLFLENAALLKSESILLCYYHIVSITPPTFTLGLIAVIIMRGKRFYPKKVPGPEHIYTHIYIQTFEEHFVFLKFWEWTRTIRTRTHLTHCTLHCICLQRLLFSLPSFILPLSALLRKPLGNRCHGNMINWRHSSHWIGIDQQIQDKHEQHTHTLYHRCDLWPLHDLVYTSLLTQSVQSVHLSW